MTNFTLDAETFKQLQPVEYYRRFLSQGARPDGRRPQETRKIKINSEPIKRSAGSATVKIGNTIVICAIKAEVAEPLPKSPREGFFVPNIDLPALCSSKFKPGPPGELTQSISEQINQLFLSVPILNLSDLCIEPGQAVWTLFADMICLHYDGSIVDACLLALMASLRNTSLPTVEYDGQVRIVDDALIPLKLSRIVVNTSFCIFDGEVLIDPTDEEEELSSSQLSITIDHAGDLCGINKLGGEGIDEDALRSCIQLARERTAETIKVLEM
ncbi:Exosome complex component RRP43 [Kappamyces sp. JEL0829]|nr:Exosome complex component RRP43 [Kappamyces sp. JEL0829]